MRLAALSLLSAALLSLSIRPWGSGYLAWAALVPLLFVLYRQRSLWRGALAGALASLGLSIVVFSGAAVSEPWTYPALVMTQALWWAGAGAGYVLIGRNLGLNIALASFPFVWTAVGTLSSLRWLWGDLANPVARLGYTQFDTFLLGAAHWSSVSGVAFLVLCINLGLFCLLQERRIVPLLMVAGLTALAVIAPAVPKPTEETPLRVAIVQGAVRSIDILLSRFDDEAAEDVLAPYRALTEKAQRRNPDLVVWGETIIPQPLTPGEAPERVVEALAAADTALVGAVSRMDGDVYNSAFSWSDNHLTEVYRKRALVPLVEAVYGHGVPVPPVPVAGVRLGIGICLDSVFPGIIRDAVLRGAEALVFLTDDSFAGQTATPEIHLRISAFRAAETGRPALFVAQSGPSAYISAQGDIVSKTRPGEAVALLGDLQGHAGTTLFVRFGDWLGVLSALLSLFAVLFCLVLEVQAVWGKWRSVSTQDLSKDGIR